MNWIEAGARLLAVAKRPSRHPHEQLPRWRRRSGIAANAAAVAGSVQLPVVVMLWGAGLGWYAGSLGAADANVGSGAAVLQPLAAVPRVHDPLEMNRNLKIALQTSSDVVSGRWQPADAVPVPQSQVEPSRVAANVQTAGPQRDRQGESVHFAAAVAALRQVVDERASGESREVDVTQEAATVVADRSAASTAAAIAGAATEDAGGVSAPPLGPDGDMALDGTSSSLRITRSRVKGPPRALRHQELKGAARQLLADGDRATARHAYELLLGGLDTLRADDREYLGMLAVAALASGKNREAAVTYRHLIERDPGNARWWTGLAVVEEQRGRRAASKEAYAQVARLSHLDSSLALSLERFARQRAAPRPPDLG